MPAATSLREPRACARDGGAPSPHESRSVACLPARRSSASIRQVVEIGPSDIPRRYGHRKTSCAVLPPGAHGAVGNADRAAAAGPRTPASLVFLLGPFLRLEGRLTKFGQDEIMRLFV